MLLGVQLITLSAVNRKTCFMPSFFLLINPIFSFSLLHQTFGTWWGNRIAGKGWVGTRRNIQTWGTLSLHPSVSSSSVQSSLLPPGTRRSREHRKHWIHPQKQGKINRPDSGVCLSSSSSSSSSSSVELTCSSRPLIRRRTEFSLSSYSLSATSVHSVLAVCVKAFVSIKRKDILLLST